MRVLELVVELQSLPLIFAQLVEGQYLDPFHHAAIRRARARTLQRAGLSGAKIRTLKAVATAIEKGAIDLDALVHVGADEAHGLLTALHGIGPWTADIYLLTCIGHADAWPAGDLALQEAARIAFSLAERPTTRLMGPLAEAWRPWRGVAAHLLWADYKLTAQLRKSRKTA